MTTVVAPRFRLSAFAAIALWALWAGCAGRTGPAAFLPSDAKPWNDWLNKVVDVDLVNVLLGDLPNRGAFHGLTLVFAGVDSNAVVSLAAEKVTRRQALWQLADKYGLALTAAPTPDHPVTVLVTNRILRRENTPRQ